MRYGRPVMKVTGLHYLIELVRVQTEAPAPQSLLQTGTPSLRPIYQTAAT